MSGRKRTVAESEEDRKRVYTAFALGSSEQRAAEEAGVPRSTARRWLRCPEGQAVVETLRMGLKSTGLADELRGVATLYVAHLRKIANDPARMEKLNAVQVATVAGILLDKARALEGPAEETQKRFRVTVRFGGVRVKEDGEKEAAGGALEIEGG
jgi:hypothetical protein